MKYCKNCGSELQSGKGFCTSCGHKLEEAKSAQTAAVHHENKAPQSRRPQKPMSKKAKFTWVALGVIAIALFGGHKFLENHYSPHNVVAGLEETIEQGDLEGARDMMDFSTVGHKVKDKELKSYLQFLKENEVEVTKGLNESFSSITQGSISESIYTSNGNELLRVMKDTKKKWGLYDQYIIEAVPFQLMVSSNMPEVEVEYNGTKKELQDTLEINGLLPGEQVVKGKYRGEYSELAQKAAIDFKKAYNNTVDVVLEFEGDYIVIRSNESDSTLFVNGKSTGKKIGNYYELGPMPVDGSIVLHAEYQGEKGVIKTAEAKVMNTDEIFLEFKEEELNPVEETVASPEELSSSVGDFMVDYIYTGVKAMNQGDFSIVEPLLHPDGKAYPESKNYIDYIVSKGITEDVISVEMIDAKNQSDGQLVTLREVYDIHYSDGTTKNKTFESSYLVKRVDGRYSVWSVEDIDEL
ncbi:zinc ribbon domain-containing protein [Pseudalkalibacillus caeni]|uniref:Membrane-associated protein n=1 Tax=Exobacillus caeni TaxID=2574798 RepID=A0A5R9FAC0_9BACL|nr:hypothetical protein [Pseudalkalibacillus caeni]TLS38598.1 hypothetical protein FCL54_03610 [Pseudalkalibacillus caeni]